MVAPPKKPAAPNAARPMAKPQVADKTQASKTQMSKTQTSARNVEPVRRRADPTISLPPPSKGPRTGAAKPKEILKNRFVLEQVVGAGGMGVVYKAKDLLKVEAKDRDPYVAIKVLGEEFKSHPEAFIALQRESRKTQRIAHPNIVNVHDFDKDGDTVFMTMEYLHGTPLDKLIKKYSSTGLAFEDAWQILEGICAALSYAHGQKIIHSDLKPGNIFVTNDNVAKVFDFGIARAVAQAEVGGVSTDDRTIFDAGNLGALTPAYASLEMLNGETPDVRDDIYALGCITYELLTGAHPFGRKNAEEAQKEGLKPARIESISKHQWRVIERSLAFERENRIGSVQEFWSELNKKASTSVVAITAMVLLFLAVLAGGFIYLNREQAPQQPQLTADDFRSEIEYEIRLELLQKTISDLLAANTFDARWENLLWEEMQNLRQLLKENHPQYVDYRQQAYGLYLARINALIEQQEYENALGVIERAHRYAGAKNELDALALSVKEQLAELERLREEQAEQERLARLKQQQERQQQAEIRTQQMQEAQRREEYAVALATVKNQLRCTQIIDMSDFSVAVKKLRSLDMTQYKKAEGQIVTDLAACLQKIANTFPDRGATLKKAALELFPKNAKLTAVRVEMRDPCNESLAGLGARGRRSICQDSVRSGGKTPETVVIPAKDGMPVFAIGRYEVTVEEFNLFCKETKRCREVAGANGSLPVTGVPLQMVQEYVRWLSQETGKTYRLPTLAEWRVAAYADGRSLDANRNCRLNARGIQKGGSLLNAEIGQQNSWGLVNHVGNAQEWVLGPGGQWLAVGGSYATDMESCTLSSQRVSDGSADAETGFRVVRELARK